MSLADNTHDHGALLDSFLCILDLEDPALRGAKTVLAASCQLRISCYLQSYGVIVIIVSKHFGSN